MKKVENFFGEGGEERRFYHGVTRSFKREEEERGKKRGKDNYGVSNESPKGRIRILPKNDKKRLTMPPICAILYSGCG